MLTNMYIHTYIHAHFIVIIGTVLWIKFSHIRIHTFTERYGEIRNTSIFRKNVINDSLAKHVQNGILSPILMEWHQQVANNVVMEFEVWNRNRTYYMKKKRYSV